MANGVLVVAAASNAGPQRNTLSNEAPWMLTVGAGSVDRHFDGEVEYEPAKVVDGETLVQNRALEGVYPLVERDYCHNVGDVAGKIVICKTVQSGQDSIIRTLKGMGAAGVFLIDDQNYDYTTLLTDYDGYNVIQINYFQGRDLIDYGKTLHPSGRVSFNGVVQGINNSPTVAYFSSRGPSRRSRGLLKPDVLAPGLNIIAAASSRVAPTDGWSSLFKLMSGMSMAAPHITGVVALLKSAHPEWSPAAIKSVILTTTDTSDNSDGPILDEQHDEAPYYVMGAGHVNPSNATDPGLVYDIGEREYASYICGLLGESALKKIRNSTSTCSEVGSMPESWLNLPTIMVPLQSTSVTVPRTLTNVGPAETYQAVVQGPISMDVRVFPDTLVFSKPGEKQSFNVSVTVDGGGRADGDFVQASLVWASPYHIVRSPLIAVVGL